MTKIEEQRTIRDVPRWRRFTVAAGEINGERMCLGNADIFDVIRESVRELLRGRRPRVRYGGRALRIR